MVAPAFHTKSLESALVTYEREKVRRDRLREAVLATERTVELVRTQYLSGLTDFLSLLDAQRSLSDQQDAYASSEGRVIQALIFLNRALGGGWAPDDPENTIKETAEEIYAAADEPSGGEE